MGRKEVYRGGKESYRSDKRQEYTGDDGACPDCGCFACKCSNYNLVVQTDATPAPCLAQSYTRESDGALVYCLPAEVGFALDVSSPRSVSYSYTSGARTFTVTRTVASAIHINFCLPTPGGLSSNGVSGNWSLGEVDPVYGTGGYRWLVAVNVQTTDDLGNTTTRTVCCPGETMVWVGTSRDADSDSGLSLFAMAYVLDPYPSFYSFVKTVVYFKEIAIDNTDPENPFCKGSSTDVALGTSDSLPSWAIPTDAYGPTLDATGGSASVRTCVVCDGKTIVNEGCGDAIDPPPKHCWYLFEATLTGTTWSAWTFVGGAGSIYVGVSAPDPFGGGVPLVYRSGTVCKARMWVDGGPAPTDGTGCSMTPPTAPATLTSATHCPEGTDIRTPCDGCPTDCKVYEYDRDPSNNIYGPSISTTSNCTSAATDLASVYGVSPLNECDTGWLDNGDGYYARYLVRCSESAAPATPSYP